MTAHNVRFSADYNWIQPIAIRGYDTTLALLRWFFQHSQVQGNWIKFDYLSKSDGELTALRTAVPDLGTLTRDLGSFRTLLFHLSNHQRFSDEQNEAISTLITAWSDRATDVLRSYSPQAAPETTGYELLCTWADLGERTLLFLMKKTANSCGIINTYLKFRSQVDKLQPLTNEMVIGRTNKLSCQTAGGLALDMQKLCREQIASYFSVVPPWEDLPTLGDFLSTFVPGTTVIDVNIVQLRGYKNQRTLHKRISATQPVSIND